MDKSDNVSRLMAEGIELLIQSRVKELIKDVTSDIIAAKIKELESQISAEIQSIYNRSAVEGSDLLRVMVEIKTNKGNK